MQIEDGELRESSPGYMGLVYQYHLFKDGIMKHNTKRSNVSPIPWLTPEDLRREASLSKFIATFEKLDGFFSTGIHARYPSISFGRKVDVTDPSINISAKNRNIVGLYIDEYSDGNANISLQTFPVLNEKSANYLLNITSE